jgi:betaine-aldehyde dehydrogenase
MSLYIAPKSLQGYVAPEYLMLIDGAWRKAQSGETSSRLAPGHGTVVGQYQSATTADAKLAIASARKAFDHGSWPRMKAAERSKFLHKVADLIEQNREKIAHLDTIECGKPIQQVLSEIDGAIDIWRYAASLARTLYGESYNNLGEHTLGIVLREPIGVVSIITPWNFPFLIVSQKLPFALAAGCTAVVKPSELSSGSTLFLGQLLLDAGLPAGVVNIISGKGAVFGDVLTGNADVDMISFTGSTAVGCSAMANAARTMKKASMELGGKNPQIVFPDADLDAFADAAVFGGYFNAGECCNAGSRLIVHESIVSDVTDRIASLTNKVRVGDPLNPETQVGAIITPLHFEKISTYIAGAKEEGAEIALGGERLDLGMGDYMAPTILTNVKPEMKVAHEEIFGPVISILKFGTKTEALEIANSTQFGLSASVWSKDIDTCLEVSRGIRAGTVWVNTFMDGTPELPFGGVKQSGLGRELGRHSVEDYTESKTLNIHQGARTSWWVSNA